MSTHNIGFYENLTKIIFELSSNTHLISSAAGCKFFSQELKFIVHPLSQIIPVSHLLFAWPCPLK